MGASVSTRLSVVLALVVSLGTGCSSGEVTLHSPVQQSVREAVAPAVAAPAHVTAALQGDLLIVGWAGAAGASGYRVYVDRTSPVRVPAQTTSYRTRKGRPGTTHYVQVVAEAGGGSSAPVAASVVVPYPTSTTEDPVEPAAPVTSASGASGTGAPASASAAPTSGSAAPTSTAPTSTDPTSTDPTSTASGRTAPTSPGASNGPATAVDVCAAVGEQVFVVASALRDWESNLAVQGDLTEKLGPPGDALTTLAHHAPARTAAEIVALADQVKLMRQAFFGHGDVLGDGKQTGPRDYDTVKAKILAGVPSC